MVEQEHLDTLEREGLVVVPAVLEQGLVESLRQELDAAVQEDLSLRPDVFDKGMVHNCMSRGAEMAALLDNRTMNNYLNACFSDTCIIYAYQSSSLPPNSGNYGSRVHVDSPRFIPGYYTNMGVMFPLDDFTLENGATYYLPGSHKVESLPSDDEFYAGAKRALCSAGDMIVLNARLVHAGGVNTTDRTRHALTMNFCRSYMRQRFDLPRLLPKATIDKLGQDGRRLIGMNVRVPTTLDDFYLPEAQRLYKPNQG
ncbi:MAG: phytanoyl-CoA dioxygenase family protein [Acidiferrobacterales bacterium]|nr:phytanoyl-CoA dioxygenase family protein [Acidiferrobacterales bacterium]